MELTEDRLVTISEVASLKNDMVRVKDEIASKDQKIAELQRRLERVPERGEERAQETIKALQAQLYELQQRLGKREEEQMSMNIKSEHREGTGNESRLEGTPTLNRFDSEGSASKHLLAQASKAAHLEQANRTLQTRLESIEATTASAQLLQEQIHVLENRVEVLMRDNQGLGRKLLEQEESHARSDGGGAELAQLLLKLATLSNEIGSVKAVLAAKTAEGDADKALVIKHTKEIQDGRTTIDSLRQQVKTLEHRNSILQQECEALKAQLDALNATMKPPP